MLLSASVLGVAVASPALAQQATTSDNATSSPTRAAGENETSGSAEIVVTAELQGLQALGATTITAQDIAKQPPVNDLSDILRRQPGINLTGASSAGTYGNNRQIDIRGMGPENTLILVDGKPVQSRNSVRMGRDGERNSRGDTNWVPAEEVERIEILRGPAAARYGSGAAGGVINIVTKGPATEFRGSLSTYLLQPEDGRESDTRRVNFSAAGPIARGLGFRLFGNYNRSTGDDPELNALPAGAPEGTTPPGGREGVQNKDINGLLRWQPADGHSFDLEGGFSRQGNEYAGEYKLPSGAISPDVAAMIGEETNVLKRATFSGSYNGRLDFGTLEAIVQYEHTRNRRLNEGLAGGPEGTFNTTTEFSTATLRNWYAQSTLNTPFTTGPAEHVLTVGAEYRYEYLNDPYSMSQGIGDDQGQIPGVAPGGRSGAASADTYAAFVEDNILVGPVTLTPGLRFDRHSTFGSNWAPSLSVTVSPLPDVTLKGGIAKAFKAPNLYQSNANYLYYTRGNGCPLAFPNLGGGCYIQGNPDLAAETSVNKEIGISWAPGDWNFTATYFRNDYKDKIIAGNIPVGESVGGAQTARIFRWYNANKAVVEGVEGSVLVPLMDTLTLNTNVTYMIRNEDVETGRLLSVVPEYTINTTLDWEISEQVTFVGTFTRYGKQVPNAVFYSGGAPTEEQLRPRDPYNLVSLNLIVKVNPAFRYSLGVNNLFDQRQFRESQNNGEGANNYNEPGRAFFVTTTFTF